MEIGRPAAGAGLHKRLDTLGLAGEGRVGFQLGHFEGSALQATAQDRRLPSQPGLLQLPGVQVGSAARASPGRRSWRWQAITASLTHLLQ